MARSRKANRKKMPIPRLSWTIREFCEAVGISISSYRRLKREGRGPEELRFSEKIIRISPAVAEKWMRERTAANRAGIR